MSEQQAKSGQQTDSMGGCFLRLFWALVGPPMVLFLAAMPLMNKVSFPSVWDLAFAGGLGAVIAARLLDRQAGSSEPGSVDMGTTNRKAYVIAAMAVGILFVAARLLIPKIL